MSPTRDQPNLFNSVPSVNRFCPLRGLAVFSASFLLVFSVVFFLLLLSFFSLPLHPHLRPEHDLDGTQTKYHSRRFLFRAPFWRTGRRVAPIRSAATITMLIRVNSFVPVTEN